MRCSFAILLCTLGSVLASCQFAPTVTTAAAPRFDVRKYEAVVVAVDGGDSRRGRTSSSAVPADVRNTLEELFKTEMLKRSVRVAAHDQMQAVLQQHGQNVAEYSSEAIRAIGAATTTDAILRVSVVRYQQVRGQYQSVTHHGTVAVALIDIESCEEVWRAQADTTRSEDLTELPGWLMNAWPVAPLEGARAVPD